MPKLTLQQCAQEALNVLRRPQNAEYAFALFRSHCDDNGHGGWLLAQKPRLLGDVNPNQRNAGLIAHRKYWVDEKWVREFLEPIAHPEAAGTCPGRKLKTAG